LQKNANVNAKTRKKCKECKKVQKLFLNKN